MKKFIENGKYAVAKDSMGVDITELEKLRDVKKNIGDDELRKKLDEEIKKAETEYVERALSTDIQKENQKAKEKNCQEALEVVDAVASTFKKLIKWAYSRH
mgnify:FL=1